MNQFHPADHVVLAREPGSSLDSLPSRDSFQDRPHGTRLRYISGCKCVPCRAANSRYETERSAARRRGEHGRIVSAALAQAHILKLAAAGVGHKSVADAADVGRTVVSEIRTGKRIRIRGTTERKILEVTIEARADSALVPAKRTWSLLGKLLDEGFTRARLARELGSQAKQPALQLGKRFVLARTELAVARLYDRYMA